MFSSVVRSLPSGFTWEVLFLQELLTAYSGAPIKASGSQLQSDVAARGLSMPLCHGERESKRIKSGSKKLPPRAEMWTHNITL
jgi:hypothetical protein